MKKKITLFIAHLWQGGGERVCVNIANGFNNMNYKVTLVVFSLKSEVYLDSLNKNIKIVNLKSNNNMVSFYKLGAYLFKAQPKKILSFNYHISFFLSIYKKIFNFKMKLISRSISTISKELEGKSLYKRIILKKSIYFAYKNSDHIISQSNGMKRDLIKFLNISEEKIITIYNPVAKEIEKSSDSNSQKIKERNILFIGRLEEEKGLKYLLRIFSKLKNDDDFKKYKLTLVGEGSLKEELKKHCQKLNISNDVIFEGFREDVISFYKKSEVVVLTSLYEGFPNVLIESITLGTPVVAFDCENGPNEIIKNGKNGYLVEFLNVDMFVEKLKKVLVNGFSTKKIKKTASIYRIDNIIKKYMKVVESS